jgi:hypothetical protein
VKEKFDLGRWRTERLGLIKGTDGYQSLSRVCRGVVDYCVKRHESLDDGIIVAQKKLAEKFNVSRQTMNKYLAEIVAAGVFTEPEERRRGSGTKGGQTSNRYRLNMGLLDSTLDTTFDFTHDSTLDTGSTYVQIEATQIEVPPVQVEAVLTVRQVEEDSGEAHAGNRASEEKLSIEDGSGEELVKARLPRTLALSSASSTPRTATAPDPPSKPALEDSPDVGGFGAAPWHALAGKVYRDSAVDEGAAG